MGTGALMALGTRAMFANYSALQATSNNIANANTAGYSRQQVELATAGGQFTGAGFFGKGVDVATVSRSHNEFLTREAASTASTAAADKALSEQLQQLEKVFTTASPAWVMRSGRSSTPLSTWRASRKTCPRAKWSWHAPTSWRRVFAPPATSSTPCSRVSRRT